MVWLDGRTLRFRFTKAIFFIIKYGTSLGLLASLTRRFLWSVSLLVNFPQQMMRYNTIFTFALNRVHTYVEYVCLSYQLKTCICHDDMMVFDFSLQTTMQHPTQMTSSVLVTSTKFLQWGRCFMPLVNPIYDIQPAHTTIQTIKHAFLYRLFYRAALEWKSGIIHTYTQQLSNDQWMNERTGQAQLVAAVQSQTQCSDQPIQWLISLASITRDVYTYSPFLTSNYMTIKAPEDKWVLCLKTWLENILISIIHVLRYFIQSMNWIFHSNILLESW